ncbi:GFA family protein [Ancylobacter oerskovii]|uniref:GFA family protein n=1 Tax=Ancylobacter oerskovii TaxID=459519 RepID=A0ABW4Z3Q6_9HYPH|nr:GFA family protein [Ancylobacter oerskovii]MBS7545964.1 GFA family protein [Ancylobacter oerskovii]
MSDVPDSAARRYAGACHCGAVQFECSLDLSGAIACNCSICSAKGLVLAFAPADAFRILAGEERLNEYRFNRHVIGHMFCDTCGVEPFAKGQMPDGTPMAAVNLRVLKEVDVAGLSPTPYDGRSA